VDLSGASPRRRKSEFLSKSIRAGLEARGTPIGPIDTLIAGHALAMGVTLVTGNTREFGRVEGLTLENWLKPSG